MNCLKSLQSKSGVVTLLLACLLTYFWIRSRIGCDAVLMKTSGRTTHYFISENGQFFWTKYECAEFNPTNMTAWYPSFCFEANCRPFATGMKTMSKFAVVRGPLGITFRLEERTSYGTRPTERMTNLAKPTVPYWLIVLPLTLASGRLLLSKSGLSVGATKSGRKV